MSCDVDKPCYAGGVKLYRFMAARVGSSISIMFFSHKSCDGLNLGRYGLRLIDQVLKSFDCLRSLSVISYNAQNWFEKCMV
jgi:hypothetical protein